MCFSVIVLQPLTHCVLKCNNCTGLETATHCMIHILDFKVLEPLIMHRYAAVCQMIRDIFFVLYICSLPMLHAALLYLGFCMIVFLFIFPFIDPSIKNYYYNTYIFSANLIYPIPAPCDT